MADCYTEEKPIYKNSWLNPENLSKYLTSYSRQLRQPNHFTTRRNAACRTDVILISESIALHVITKQIAADI